MISMGEQDDYICELHHSVLEINSNEWDQLVPSSEDLAMNQRLIRFLEITLSQQARLWTISVRDKQGQLVCCACISLFQTDVLQSVPRLFKVVISAFRHLWLNIFKWKVIFCGLPIPAGHSHLRFSPGVNIQAILGALNELMQGLAKKEGARLLVFKELNRDQFNCLKSLNTMGFQSGLLPPIYELPHNFKDFDQYESLLRANYRRQIRLNKKKFDRFGLSVEYIFDDEEISARFTEEVYQLYLNVWEKAKEKLECFPFEFFSGLPKIFPGQVVMTLISDCRRPISFSIALVTNAAYHNLYIGLDYSLNRKVHLLFNLFYEELAVVFRLHKKQIYLGQKSDGFKSRLGATASARYFFVRPLDTTTRVCFKWFHIFIFPRIKYYQRKVFK